MTTTTTHSSGHNSALKFDEATHTYRLGERVLPSVTQVLREMGFIDSRYFNDEAATRGTFVARATHLDDMGTLDPATIDPRLTGYVEAWRKFKVESGIEILASEERVYDEVLGFAGMLDRRAMWRRLRAIIDIKTGSSAPWHELQLAGYAYCIHPRPDFLATVILYSDGKFKVTKHSPSEQDWRAVMHLYNWKKARNLL